MFGLRRAQSAVLAAITLGSFDVANAAMAPTASSRIEAALQNITTLVRPGRIGYATFWDGNKYVQCRRTPEREIRCEAAGSIMQPSLKRVLANERLSRLDALGWTFDPSFGNYVRAFPSDMPTDRVAEHILQTLKEVYDADPAALELQTSWVADMQCPPRNGPSQNLAGIVNDAPEMRSTAVRTCLLQTGRRESAESCLGERTHCPLRRKHSGRNPAAACERGTPCLRYLQRGHWLYPMHAGHIASYDLLRSSVCGELAGARFHSHA